MQKASSLTPTLRALTVLGVSLTILLSYNFMSAALTHDATYTDAPANPPNHNTPAPINVGSAWQNKVGLLTSSSSIMADGNVVGSILAASTAVWSDQYCNANGTKCILGSDITTLPTCADGKILIAQAGGWICGDPGLAPAPAVWLVFDQHTEKQCTSLGGTLVTEGGKEFCRFSSRSVCPAGWSQYSAWGVYGHPVYGNTWCEGSVGTENQWTNDVPHATYYCGSGCTSHNSADTFACTAPTYQIGCY